MQPWPLVSHLAEFLGETAETEDCRRRILRIRRLGVRIPPGALCVETDDQALTSGNAGWGLCRVGALGFSGTCLLTRSLTPSLKHCQRTSAASRGHGLGQVLGQVPARAIGVLGAGQDPLDIHLGSQAHHMRGLDGHGAIAAAVAVAGPSWRSPGPPPPRWS